MMNQKTIKEIAEGVLAFLRKKNLEELLPQLIEYLKKSEKGEVGYVYSPRELKENEKKQAEKLFVKVAGGPPKQINFYRDEELIDGLKLVYGDRMWDLSLKGQISKLSKI